MAISITSIGATVSVTSPMSVTAASGVPAGAIIMAFAVDNGTSNNGTITDSASNSYPSIANNSAFANNVGANGQIAVYVATTTLALAVNGTVTLTLGSGAASGALSAVYLTGSSGIDSTGSSNFKAFGSSNAVSVTSPTPSQANDLIICAAWLKSASSSFGQASGWNAPPAAAGPTASSDIFGGNQLNTGTGTLTYNPSNSASGPWGVVGMAMKTATLDAPPSTCMFIPRMFAGYMWGLAALMASGVLSALSAWFR